MHRIIVALLLCCIGPAGASPQQRTTNEGPGSMLRQWPTSGPWQVVLTRVKQDDLMCVMLTGHGDAASGELYFWGLRNRGGAHAVVIADMNARAISGEAITISVDGAPAGTFPVVRRLSEGGMNYVSSDLDATEFGRLNGLLQLGGRIVVSTPQATYSETLQGAARALAFLGRCAAEVKHLAGGRSGR